MKTLVVYKSKTGYVETYAKWIQEELQCDLAEASQVNVEKLKAYDTIIYGGGLYAGGLNGIKLLRDNFDVLKNKNLVAWATGCSPGHPEDLQKVWEQNLTEEMRGQIKTYYLRGGFDYKKLHKMDKVLMKMLKIRLKAMKDKPEDAIGMLHAYDVPEYHCKKENIQALVEYIKSI